jgi:hypothetical protein
MADASLTVEGRDGKEVDGLRKRVSEGNYQVDPRAVAEAILRRRRPSSAFVCGVRVSRAGPTHRGSRSGSASRRSA